MWKVITQITNKLQTFVNCCLRSIMGVRWPKVIRNTRLWEGNGENPLILQIRLRKWHCIGRSVTKGDDFTGGRGIGLDFGGSRQMRRNMELG